MTYDQLNGITKSRIQQAAQRLAEWHSKFFCCKSEQGGKWNDGEEVEHKNRSWVPLQSACDDAQGYKNQEYVDIIGPEDFIGQM